MCGIGMCLSEWFCRRKRRKVDEGKMGEVRTERRRGK